MIFDKNNTLHSAHYANQKQGKFASCALRETQEGDIIICMDIGKSIRSVRKARGMTLEQLANLADTDSGNLSRLERGVQGVSQELLTRLMTVLDLHITEYSAKGASIADGGAPHLPSKDDYALVRQFDAAAECGDGYLNDHVELSDGLAFKRDWLSRVGAKPENLAIIYATGDSMEPYIFDGDVVLFDTADVTPRHGHVYVVRRPDCSVSIKRLIHQISGDWVIKSDNPDRSEEKVSAETIHEIPLIGRVIWRGGNIS